MTQAERLIRNLCEERRLGLLEHERKFLKALAPERPWRDLSNTVKGLVNEHRRLEKRQTAIMGSLKTLGFSPHYSPKPGRALLVANYRDQTGAAQGLFARRREAVKALQTTAVIASLGKSATEARAILEKLQKDLAKI